MLHASIPSAEVKVSLSTLPEKDNIQKLEEAAKAGSQNAQWQLALFYFSKKQIKEARAYLELVANNASGSKAVCNLATVILKNEGLSLLRLINTASDFNFSKATGGRTNVLQNFVHCASTAGEQVSLITLSGEISIDELTDHLSKCSDSLKGSSHKALAVIVKNPTPDDEKKGSQLATNIELCMVYSRANFLYREGTRRTKAEPLAAFNHFTEAANLKHPEAQLAAAEMLLGEKEMQIDQNIEAALKFFRQAAEQKDADPHAMYRLGYVLTDPSTIDYNSEEGFKWLQKAAEKNHFESCFLLGRICFDRHASIETSSSKEDKDTQTTKHLDEACHWFTKALQAYSSTLPASSKENYFKAHSYLATAYDLLNKAASADGILELAANKGHSLSQLFLAIRYQLDKNVTAEKQSKAKKWLSEAAKPKCRPVDNDPAVLVANALIFCDFESIPHEKLAKLVRNGIEFRDPTFDRNAEGQLAIDCLPLATSSQERVQLVDIKITKQEDVNKHIFMCLDPSKEQDPSEHPLAVALNVAVLDGASGLHTNLGLALVMPSHADTKPTPEPKQKEVIASPQQRIIIMRSGHHANNWLTVMGDLDRVLPTVLKYLNRDWKRDISERNSGLEWLPQRLHLSLGKPTFGDVYVGKIGVGCSVWMYTILSTPPPTLRPEIHTVFPVVVAKARKYWLTVEQMLEWHNRIEATMICKIASTTDPWCINNSTVADKKATSASKPVAMDITPDDSTSEPMEITPDVPAVAPTKAVPQRSDTLPVFAIDFVSRRNIWEGRGHLEVFLSGIASVMYRNPQFSTQIKVRRHPSAATPWSMDTPLHKGSLNYRDDDERKDAAPVSVVPNIVGTHGRTYPWSMFKNLRGIISNEGPRKENRVVYAQGRCMKTVQLPGTIWGKGAYMVTIRIDEERNIDLDIWCLLKHMIDGRATITPGEYMTIPAGSVPEYGDLVFADVWIHGTIATGLDPVPTAGEEVNKDARIKAEAEEARIKAEEEAKKKAEGITIEGVVLASAPVVTSAATATPAAPAANASSVPGTMFAPTGRSYLISPDAVMSQEQVHEMPITPSVTQTRPAA